MDKIKYILLGIICIGIGVLIGISVKPNPIATIVILNSSSKVLQSACITIGMTSYIIDNIEQNKSKTVNVFVAGEAGYRIKVNFANGDSLVNWNYIESGNKINEKVTDSSMVSAFISQ